MDNTEWLGQYAAAAAVLEDGDLVFIYGNSLLQAQHKTPAGKAEAEERRNVLSVELVRRGINPYYLTLDQFQWRLRFDPTKTGELAGMTRSCFELANIARMSSRGAA